MPQDDRLAAWLRITLTPSVPPADLRRLLADFGEPERILAASRGSLAHAVGDNTAAAIVRGPRAATLDAALEWSAQPDNHVVTLADAAYPAALLEIPDPPPLLYVKGRTELLNRPALAIVGSRNATSQGLANAESFATALSDAGLLIVSGLALGADAAAHRGGLNGRSASLAVLGTGPDIVYPSSNRDLAHELARTGALLSEFCPGTPARPENFPRRNRLISGLCLGTLVIEASLGSGSLITARCAAEQGREVFALPGSIHSPLAKGCHALIKQGAKLVESAADVLEELRFAPRSMTVTGSSVSATATPDERKLLDALGFDAVDPDTLAQRSGFDAARVAALLTQLELSGAIVALPGPKFQRPR